jgi:hypothetical protein
MPLHDDSDRSLRQQQLLELLRHLAARIHAIDGVEGLHEASAELDRLLDTARYTLVHLDDPSPTSFRSADHQRIVDEARQASISFDQPGEDLPWRHPQAE